MFGSCDIQDVLTQKNGQPSRVIIAAAGLTQANGRHQWLRRPLIYRQISQPKECSDIRSAVMTLARMRAKKAVLLTLRAQGFKPQHFSAREIAILTDYYLNQHRARLIAEAEEIVETWPGFAGWRLPPGQNEVFVKSTKIEHSPNADSTTAGEIANG